MRRFLALAVAVGALSVPAVALASAGPSWCDSSGPICFDAHLDLDSTLDTRYGKDWEHARPKLDSCPVEASYGETVPCAAYFRSNATYQFLFASVDRAQNASGIAKITSITTWHRRWHRCSLRAPAGSPVRVIPGTLESNQPCNSLPMEPRYTVGDEMSGQNGSVHYHHEVGWQFMDSGPFLAGMRPVELATCGYKHRTITCTDREGDSFRYLYP